jgi:hypothetical protein
MIGDVEIFVFVAIVEERGERGDGIGAHAKVKMGQ